jgi:hypothetical protein
MGFASVFFTLLFSKIKNMEKRTLRKELELDLIRAIAETLGKRNAIAGKQIKKKVEEASKTVAKKFYKAIKQLNLENAETPSSTAKKSVKKTPASAKLSKASAKKKK